MIDNLDDLKQALDIDSFNYMSKDRVLRLVKLLQSGEVSDEAIHALQIVAPNAFVQLLKALDEQFAQVLSSNDTSSQQLHDQYALSKKMYGKRLEDPNISDEERNKVYDLIKDLDDKVFEHDVNNKKLGLQAIHIKKEVVIAAATVIGGVVLVVVLPESSKTVLQNLPKLALRKG